jgi:integration host factor subunit beta
MKIYKLCAAPREKPDGHRRHIQMSLAAADDIRQKSYVSHSVRFGPSHIHLATPRELMAGSVLTRSELIAEIATSNAHLRAEDVETVVATILDGIASALARGDRVDLRRFGAFTVRRRGPRVGRDPRNGGIVSVDAKSVPFFKAGKELRLRVDAGT